MYERERDGRREVAVTDIEALVPENHLVRKIEKVMDYEWIYERVAPYYSEKCKAGDRPGGTGENGAAPAPVRDPVAEADISAGM